MITYDHIIEAQNFLVENWGEKGKQVIEACFRSTPYNDTFDNFLEKCTACGGNWSGMLLSGIRKLWPEVHANIPDDMGIFAWGCICYTLLLCGVDTTTLD